MTTRINRALSIDEIFAATRQYDYIITADTPLAEALNNRIENPRLGKFAYTPRGLVYENLPASGSLMDRRELFLQLLREFPLEPNKLLYQLENILDCWQETGSAENILKFKGYNSHSFKQLLDYLRGTDNIFRHLEEFQPDPTANCCIIAPYQFKTLDRSTLCDNYPRLDPLLDSRWQLPEFNLYSSAREITDTVLASLKSYSATEIAVVVDPKSSYQALLEAELQAEKIPYYPSLLVSESTEFRSFIGLLKLSLEGTELDYRTVSPMIHSLALVPSGQYQNELITELDDSRIKQFLKLLNELQETRFETALQRFEKMAGVDLTKTAEIFAELQLLDKKITEKRIRFFEFYMESFNPSVEITDRPGVLLVSPTGSSFIDRPVIFYLGLDQSWSGKEPNRPWRQADKNRQRNLKDFCLLLQNGIQQHFLVQNFIQNKPVKPSPYLNLLSSDRAEKFSDFSAQQRLVKKTESITEKPFSREFTVPPKTSTSFSQSALNRFVESPRNYLFERLTPTYQNRYLKTGTIYHEFAEFYLEHPEFVKNSGLTKLTETAYQPLAAYYDPLEKPIVLSKLQLGMETIMSFLDARLERIKRSTTAAIIQPENPDRHTNYFANQYNLPLMRNYTELSFHEEKLGVTGKIDLLLSPRHIVDYKSGRRRTVRQSARLAKVNLLEDAVDFQPILYLFYLQSLLPDKKLEFSFFYFLEELNEQLTAHGNQPEPVIETVNYFPVNFSKLLTSEELYRHLINNAGSSTNRLKLLNRLEFNGFKQFFQEKQWPEQMIEKIEENDIYREFVEFCENQVGNHKYVSRGAKGIFKRLTEFREINFFPADLENFSKFLEVSLEKLNQYNRSRFPVRGELEQFEIDDLPNRDLLLSDNHETE